MTLDVKKLRERNVPVMNKDGTVTLEGIDFSAVDQYLRCPEQYRFRNIDGRKSPPAIALVEGTSHHRTLEWENKAKLEKMTTPTAATLVDHFAHVLKLETEKAEEEADAIKTSFDWEGENRDKLLKRGRKLLTHYASEFSPGIEPTSAEESFSVPVDVDGVKFTLFGQIDLTERKYVVDYKVTGRPKSQRDVDESLQLSVYAFAKRASKASFINFVKASSPYVQRVDSVRTPMDWRWALRVVASAVDGIRRGSFPKTAPGPMNWWCSERFCGYWASCRGKVRG